ncbi:radical SAM protein [Salmonella enterica subsp. enterica serovar Enteritidis]|nr:radical SAM protein [Salmonella enterica subsp. enterica serovar Enteritidis]
MHDTPKSSATMIDIALTSKCNLNCSFCGGAAHMAKGDVSKTKHKEAMVDIIKENPQVEEFLWTGGEPLLAYQKLVDFVGEAREQVPSAKHLLFTNGRKLKPSQLDFLKTFDRIIVSIDTYEGGERSLMAFVEEGAQEAFEVMYELDNVVTWGVLTREHVSKPRWFEDTMRLHSALHHLRLGAMTLTFDKLMPKPLNQDHVLNFIYGYKQIEDQMRYLNSVNGINTVFRLEKFFDHTNCNACGQLKLVEPNGDIKHNENVEFYVNSGCNAMAQIIGVEAYKYLHNYLNLPQS